MLLSRPSLLDGTITCTQPISPARYHHYSVPQVTPMLVGEVNFQKMEISFMSVFLATIKLFFTLLFCRPSAQRDHPEQGPEPAVRLPARVHLHGRGLQAAGLPHLVVRPGAGATAPGRNARGEYFFLTFSLLRTYPTTNGVMQNGSSVAKNTHIARLAPICMLSRV